MRSAADRSVVLSVDDNVVVLSFTIKESSLSATCRTMVFIRLIGMLISQTMLIKPFNIFFVFFVMLAVALIAVVNVL